MHLFLTASGFRQTHIYEAFLTMLDSPAGDCSVAIITTASRDWKEANKHAVATRKRLEQSCFRGVEYIDVEHQDPKLLRDFDVIFINGGNPFHLLHHLNESGGSDVIRELAHDGRLIVGNSAGSMVMEPDLSIATWFTPEMNVHGIADAPALSFVPFTAFPHYGKREDNEPEIRRYEAAFGRKVVRLPDSQAVHWKDGEATLVTLVGRERL